MIIDKHIYRSNKTCIQAYIDDAACMLYIKLLCMKIKTGNAFLI